jgi:hypothetical protein
LSTSSLKYECWTGDYVCTGNAINFVAFENWVHAILKLSN